MKRKEEEKERVKKQLDEREEELKMKIGKVDFVILALAITVIAAIALSIVFFA